MVALLKVIESAETNHHRFTSFVVSIPDEPIFGNVRDEIATLTPALGKPNVLFKVMVIGV